MTLFFSIPVVGATPLPQKTVDKKTANDFEVAAFKSPETISSIAVAYHAGEPGAFELNELQARLLDYYKGVFFSQWTKIPKAQKTSAQKLRDFILLTPDIEDDVHAKINVYENRLNLLKSAPKAMPATLKDEVTPLIEILKDEIATQKKRSAQKTDDGEIGFKKSALRPLLAEKFSKVGSFDGAKATSMANEILLNEGLNFKGYLKGESNNWNICSASTTASQGACHSSTVSYARGSDSCGPYGVIGVLFQAENYWFVMAGSSSYRINTTDILNPVGVVLEKEGLPYRRWSLPDGFSPEGISTDLHIFYASTAIRGNDGKKLADLHLQLRDNGRFQFEEQPKGFTRLTAAGGGVQEITALDGSKLKLRLPQNCF